MGLSPKNGLTKEQLADVPTISPAAHAVLLAGREPAGRLEAELERDVWRAAWEIRQRKLAQLNNHTAEVAEDAEEDDGIY